MEKEQATSATVMKVDSTQLTETEKDLIDIYGEQRILKTVWCYENDSGYKNWKNPSL